MGLVPIFPVIFEAGTSVIPDFDRITKWPPPPRSTGQLAVAGGLDAFSPQPDAYAGPLSNAGVFVADCAIAAPQAKSPAIAVPVINVRFMIDFLSESAS
jgi:hypothetical protein